MEHLGQQKERLIERLKQRQEQELGEVEKLAKAVLDEPRRALRTFKPMAAGTAERERRIAAAVEKEQRLLLLGHRLGHGGDERFGKPFAGLQPFGPEIDRRDVRHRDA